MTPSRFERGGGQLLTIGPKTRRQTRDVLEDDQLTRCVVEDHAWIEGDVGAGKKGDLWRLAVSGFS